MSLSKYLTLILENNVLKHKWLEFLVSSSGVGDGGKPVATDPTTGKLHPSVIPNMESPASYPTSETLPDNCFVNLFVDSGVWKARKADFGANMREAHGFVKTGATAPDAVVVYPRGRMPLTGVVAGAIIGDPATPGKWVQGSNIPDPATATNILIQELGYGVGTNEAEIDIETPHILA